MVVNALASQVARTRGWRVVRREEQIAGMKGWGIRGFEGAVRDVADEMTAREKGLGIDVEEIADACVRCEKGTGEGTQGFFVVGFVREEREGGIGGEVRGASGNGNLATDDAAEDEEKKEEEEEEEEEEWEGFAE